MPGSANSITRPLRYFNAVGYAADKSITGKERNPQNLMPIIMEAATGKREKFSIFRATITIRRTEPASGIMFMFPTWRGRIRWR